MFDLEERGYFHLRFWWWRDSEVVRKMVFIVSSKICRFEEFDRALQGKHLYLPLAKQFRCQSIIVDIISILLWRSYCNRNFKHFWWPSRERSLKCLCRITMELPSHYKSSSLELQKACNDAFHCLLPLHNNSYIDNLHSYSYRKPYCIPKWDLSRTLQFH